MDDLEFNDEDMDELLPVRNFPLVPVTSSGLVLINSIWIVLALNFLT